MSCDYNNDKDVDHECDLHIGLIIGQVTLLDQSLCIPWLG